MTLWLNTPLWASRPAAPGPGLQSTLAWSATTAAGASLFHGDHVDAGVGRPFQAGQPSLVGAEDGRCEDRTGAAPQEYVVDCRDEPSWTWEGPQSVYQRPAFTVRATNGFAR